MFQDGGADVVVIAQSFFRNRKIYIAIAIVQMIQPKTALILAFAMYKQTRSEELLFCCE